jgi:hypothetical protein
MLSQSSSPANYDDDSDPDDYNDDSDSRSVCRGRKWIGEDPPAIVAESDRCSHQCPFCTFASCERTSDDQGVQCLCNTCENWCSDEPCPQCCGTGGVVCILCTCCVGFHSQDGLITANTADEFLAKSVALHAQAPALDASASKLVATTTTTAHEAAAGPSAAGPAQLQ